LEELPPASNGGPPLCTRKHAESADTRLTSVPPLNQQALNIRDSNLHLPQDKPSKASILDEPFKVNKGN
jgi:hypothetical protein